MKEETKQTEDYVSLAFRLYPFSNPERNAFINGYNKAKEMEKERIKQIWDEGVISATYGKPINFEQYYNETYGGDK